MVQYGEEEKSSISLDLEKAERINPEAPFVQLFRQVLNLEKQTSMFTKSKPGKPRPKRRR